MDTTGEISTGMYYKVLVDKGAEVIDPFTYSPDRLKASGRMWDGGATIRLDGVTYHFKMWYHGPEKDPGEEEMMSHLSLNIIEVPGFATVDVYWAAYITETQIWMRSNGWFNDNKLDKRFSGIRANYNWAINDDGDISEAELLALGFTKILEV